jgi:hypothetical protein
MEKGLGYNIDMRSTAIDAHLSLFDPQGEPVATDDDSGGDFNARILFDPQVNGEYRLLAADFKKGVGAFSIDIAKVKLPASTAVNLPLKTEKRQEAGCDVVQADLGAGSNMPFTFAWSADGKAFFLFDRFLTLRRIRYPEFVEDRRVSMKEPAQTHLTAEGLLVSTLASRELWLFDPQTLQLKRRLPRVGGFNILAAPSLAHIYVTANFNKAEGGQVPGLMRHELSRSQTVSFPFAKLPITTQFLALTPDGRHLVGRKDNQMMRWRVQDNKIFAEEAGTRYFRNWTDQNPPLVISADGKLLLHPINNRAGPMDGIQPGPPSDHGVAGYRVNDFKNPAFVLDTGYSYAPAAIDPKSGLICVHTKIKGFVLADPQGKIIRELAINTRVPSNLPVVRMAFHPDGGRLLAFYGSGAAPKVLSIELPKDLAETGAEKK